MALALSRHLRRAIPLSSYLLRPLRHAPPQFQQLKPLIQTVGFKSSTQLFNYRSDYKSSEDNKISPDEILFEGCDYKHWLITMDFPKDPQPTPEEMVEAYVQTCAKVLGSVEEAKKRIYACSTTTYMGFQVEVDEETSEKFRGLPGVVFILPDSYLYPETKEYGGDKYENGVITPRPPPIQYGTQNRRRDRNRFDQNQNRPFNRQQGNFRSYPSQQGNFQDHPPNQQGSFQDYPPNQQQGNFQNYPPNQQGTFQNYPPQQQQGNFQKYPPQQHGNFPNYPYGQTHPAPLPQRGRDGGGYQRDYNQGQRGNFAPQEQRNFSQGPPGYGGDEGYGAPMQGQHDAWKERR